MIINFFSEITPELATTIVQLTEATHGPVETLHHLGVEGVVLQLEVLQLEVLRPEDRLAPGLHRDSAELEDDDQK
jgi:hypothetical protein